VATGAPDLDALREGFTHAYLVRVDPQRNARRFYYLAWQPTIFDGWAVVRIHGRLGSWEHALPLLPFADLAAAWPTIRAILRRRIRHGYELAPLPWRGGTQA
jgi:predicted DNA-binding WGR domain protein